MTKQNIGSTIFYSFIQVISAIFFLYMSASIFGQGTTTFLIIIYLIYFLLNRTYKKNPLYVSIGHIFAYLLWIFIWSGFTEFYHSYTYDSYNPKYLWDILYSIILGMVITYFLAGSRFIIYYFIYLFIFIFLYLF